MDLDFEKLKKAGKKPKGVVMALGVGVSALAGTVIFDNSHADANDLPANIDNSHDTPQEISAQIDENRNKLESLSTSDKDSTDYTKYGC